MIIDHIKDNFIIIIVCIFYHYQIYNYKNVFFYKINKYINPFCVNSFFLRCLSEFYPSRANAVSQNGTCARMELSREIIHNIYKHI